MAHLTGEELYDIQYDTLWETTEGNPQLAPSTISSRNKALQTNNKRIIGAINEVNKDTINVKTSLANMAAEYNSIIGDFSADSTLVDKIKEIDENIILAVYKLYNENLTLKAELTTLTDKVNKLIEDSNITDNPSTETICSRAYAEDEFVFNGSYEFNLSNTNILEDDFEFLLNGIEYQLNDAVTLDKERGIVTWVATAENGGFDLDSEFEILVQYWYEKN